MEKRLVAFDIRGQEWVKALLSAALVQHNLDLVRKDELRVFLHFYGVVVHWEEYVGIQLREQNLLIIVIIDEFLHEFLLLDSSYHEILNQPLRDLFTRCRILH